MALNPDIRDQAYQFFIEEAPELLQVIEAGLLTLRQERSTAKVHDLMRAAHSLKGGAASVELEAIKSLAHRLENIFKALYNETIEIDTDLESQILQAYDCLRLPLIEQIQIGSFDAEEALALAEPIFAQIEQRLGDALTQADTYIPSSSDLGIDMAQSIFEVDIGQGLEHLARVVTHPNEYEVAGELRAQAEVFAGFAELLNQSGFGAIAQTALTALKTHPEQALIITQLALADFEFVRHAVLSGKAQDMPNMGPSAALLVLAGETATADSGFTVIADVDIDAIAEDSEDVFPSLEELLSAQFDESLISCPAEYLHFGGDKADGRRQMAEGKEEGCKVKRNDGCFAGHDIILDEVLEDIQNVESDAKIDNAAELIEEGFVPPQEVVASCETQAEQELQISPLNEDERSNLQRPAPANIEEAVDAIAQNFDNLSLVEELPPLPRIASLIPAQPNFSELSQASQSAKPTHSTSQDLKPGTTPPVQRKVPVNSSLSVRVDSERLARMNNLVGELAINRNGLSLQNQQLQRAVRELLARFGHVQGVVGHLRELSDKMLVTPERHDYKALLPAVNQLGELIIRQADFDSLELDNYGVLNSRLQGLIEDMVQLEEAVDDVALFAKQSDRTLEQQRQMLTQLRDELMWARMLPLGEVLNRFPRVLRDLSATYHKSVSLNINGAGVLVDKGALEKLYDPLLHLLRNAFDHGIEPPEVRRQQGKPEQGRIEIWAYHQGSQTIIEVKDDGRGLDTKLIGRRAVELGFLSADELETTSRDRWFELLFEPGFSTAQQVSELSGRGVGLDVVRSQMRSLKGTITVASSPGEGTSFTLRLPLTLTIAKLLVCLIGATAVAVPSDSVEEIVIPKSDRVKNTGEQRFLRWRGQVVPAYRLADLLHYACPLPDTCPSKALVSVPSPQDWALPMLILKQGQQVIAIEIDRLVTEQELVIKPFGSAIAPPNFTYGCTILGDGSLIPVIDGTVLLDRLLGQTKAITRISTGSKPISLSLNENPAIAQPNPGIKTAKTPTVLVVDDAAALRRTLALSLERAGCRVLQARDGREAIEQLRQSASVNLVVCDIEMPNMNGFEFLSQRRQDSQLSKIPVVMLTSRSNDKHRWLAMQLGATAYFTKPYLEQEFLTAIKHIIDEKNSELAIKPSPEQPQLQPVT